MKSALFHFDQELTGLLPRAARSADFAHPFTGPQTAKHLVESLGIPHTEIGSLLANGRPVGLNYLVQEGDELEFRAAGLDRDTIEEPRFILDAHLGRLNSRLRMLGLDCLYRNSYDDRELAATAVAERRTLLTRDRRLLMRKSITHGYLIRSLDSQQQLEEVVQRFRLEKWIRPFHRCIRCNHLLEPVDKETVLDRLEPLTRIYYEEFHLCPACGQIYWRGSHVNRMQVIIDGLGKSSRSSPRQEAG